MVTQSKPYGLVINVGKSELHSWGGAPHTTIRILHQGRSYRLSTINDQGEPHVY